MAQHLLHIDSTAATRGSDSKQLAAVFRRVWAEECPAGTVVHRDLATDPLPHLDEAAISAQFVPKEGWSPEQRASSALRDELIGELLEAEGLLISAPMYNWNVPSTLKAWLDWVLQQGRILPYGDGAGPLAGRPVTVVLTYGGGYMPGAPLEKWDHLDPYLRTVFTDALGMDLAVITAQLTLAGRAPGMDHLVELGRQSRIDAEKAIEERARRFAGLGGRVTAAV
ncbi:FMN-dependent NADH-azoreductase [Actinocorallia populi]|uniref:FMN-dependent NADH-azoreductase n=1 Tax=Actinocorallia populi TaxID=2079200 RepID=UPI000D090004|nr:NAD(P)H-dependent oxidoreductase [Actinocorallia populi]